jgi:hypothetical protein
MEALAAAAPPFLIGVVEDKLASNLIFDKVHGGSDERHEGFAVDDDLVVVLLDDFVEFARLFHVVHGVGEPVAPLLGESNFDADLCSGYKYYLRVVFLLEQGGDPPLGRRGLLYCRNTTDMNSFCWLAHARSTDRIILKII